MRDESTRRQNDPLWEIKQRLAEAIIPALQATKIELIKQGVSPNSDTAGSLLLEIATEFLIAEDAGYRGRLTADLQALYADAAGDWVEPRHY